MDAFSAADQADAILEQGQTGLRFHGNGTEYFKIWIVNLALSVLTLGIFSAWAKVRAQRYFHANTELDGSRFEYHGNAISILLGRGLAALLLVGFLVLGQFNPALGALVLLAALVVFPWLTAQSMRFRTRMVSWRGVRFAWTGTTGRVYGQLLICLFFTIITFGIYYFAAHHRIKRLFIDRLHFGNQPFSASSESGDFFAPYFLFGIAAGVLNLASGALQKSLSPTPEDPSMAAIVVSLLTIALAVVMFKLLGALLNRLIHNTMKLAHLRLKNTTDLGELFSLYGSNLVLMVLTLGLYWPWARIKEMEYRLTHLEILGNLPMLEAAATLGGDTAALGQEATALFDFDVSL